jgi:hypothetical protein
MGMFKREWGSQMQNGVGAPSQPAREGSRMRNNADPAVATRPLSAEPGRPTAAVRRWGAAALVVAAAAAIGVVAAPADTASARPLPGDNPLPTCRVDVRAADVLGGVAKHLFVVWHGPQGLYKYYRGGPDRHSASRSHSSSGSRNNAPRRIVTEYGSYKPGTIDYDPQARSVTVLLGHAACDKGPCFAAQARRIKKRHLVYHSLGPNSNSVAHTLLVKCHVPVGNADLFRAPGFDKVL